MRQRGLAKAWRPEQEHMIQCFRTCPCSIDEDFQLTTRLFLTHVLIQNLRTQGPFECFFLSTLSSRGYQTIGFNHRRILQGFESNFSACLMPSATLLSAGSCLTTAWDSRSL